MKYPKISFITPMKEKDFRVIALLKSIRNQDYPKEKIEIIITDGGSNPKVLKECKKYGVKIYNNPKMLAEGAGMGKDQGIWHSTGDYIVIAESDIELMESDWIKKMLKPFQDDKEIFAAVPRVHIHPNDSPTNRYLSYVGVDPFAAYRSIEGQLELNKKIPRKKKEGYDLLYLDKNKPYCMGSNGFMFKKSLIKDAGDYAQDVEFIARVAKKGHKKFAFVKGASIWHKNIPNLDQFIKKRIKWTKNYSNIYVNEKKDFNWITNKWEFLFYTLKNLLFFPNIPMSIKKTIEHRDSAWLLHAPLMLFSTGLNVYYSLTSKAMLKQVFGK